MHFFQRQRDIPQGGEVGEEVELLEEKSVFPPIRLERGRVLTEAGAVDGNGAGVA